MTRKKLTKHEKAVEIAKAGATKYGIYFDGGSPQDLEEIIETIRPVLMAIIEGDMSESNRKLALEILKGSIPSIQDVSITNTNVSM